MREVPRMRNILFVGAVRLEEDTIAKGVGPEAVLIDPEAEEL